MVQRIITAANKCFFQQHWINRNYLKKNQCKQDFQHHIDIVNLNRLKIAIVSLLLFALSLLIIDALASSPWSLAERRLFLMLDITLLIFVLIVGFFVYFARRLLKKDFLGFESAIIKITVLFVIIWSAIISNIESNSFQYFPTYSLIIIVFSWYFYNTGSFMAGALTIGFIALYFGHYLLPNTEHRQDDYYQIAIIISVIGWVVSRTLYHNREQIFIDKLKLEQVIEHLEKRAKDRTIELQTTNVTLSHEIAQRKKYENSLIKVKSKAEESDRLKSTFLANMSHEIRTPMNGIIGFSGLLQHKNVPKEKAARYLNMIQNNCKQLLIIIDDILDLSKIEANQIILKESTFKPVEVLKKIIELFNQYKKEIKRENVALILENSIHNHPLYIKGDVNRIQQIINNFMRNALKFTHEGSIQFGYNLTNEEIIFYVKDDGIGIPKKKQPYVFDRFYQADDSEIRKHSGAGLGLTISMGLAALMNGEIWFESIEKKGSTFYFSLPLKISEPVTEKVSKTKTPHENSIILSHKKILIVEDDFPSYHFLKEMLMVYNVKITHAIHGREALEICKKEQPFDMILMDLQLPEINGFELTKRLRSLYPKTPVIAQTANILINSPQRTQFDDVILKPISEAELIKKMVALLQK